jgi:hypothetical protein
VFLHKITRIPLIHINKEVYVTVTLILPNKTTQKRKTKEIKLSLSDIPLHSTVLFNLPSVPLEGTRLLLQVKVKQGLILGKKTVIGGVLIGRHSTASQTETEHWQNVIDSKGAMIRQQHQLHF